MRPSRIIVRRPKKYDISIASFFLIGASCFSSRYDALSLLPFVKFSVKRSTKSFIY